MTIDINAPSYVADPKRINNDNELSWSEEADVVVAGYGGAGVCAALEARSQGADVLALDRFDGGGATSLCGGVYYGGGTPFQKEAGYEDSADNMYRYLKSEVGDAVKDSTLRRFCEQSYPNMEWLMSHGVKFGSKVYKGKISYPPGGYDLYFSGNEVTYPNSEVAEPAPRGHRVVGENFTGFELFDALQNSAAKLGVRFQGHTRINRLVLDATGRVIGVEATRLKPGSEAWQEHQKIIEKMKTLKRHMEKYATKHAKRALEIEQQSGETVYIRARKGVIITTGSNAFNRKMVEAHAPRYAGYMYNGTISCDGSGIGLGQSVGAALGYMDSVTAWRSISPPPGFARGIIVNKLGKRFVTEDAYLGRVGHEVALQPDGAAWVVVDSATYWEGFKSVIPRKGGAWLEMYAPVLLNLVFNRVRGKTVEQLAERCGIDAEGLAETVALYNQGTQSGDDALRKNPKYLKPLKQGALYAFDLRISNKVLPCPAIPMGGLRVNEDTGQVIDEQGRDIPGLYAGGRGVVGIPSGFYVSGSAVADCVFSGRRAGRSVVHAD